MSSHGEGLPSGARKIIIALIGIVITALSYQGYIGSSTTPLEPAKQGNNVGYYYTVTKVTDGDTIHVDMNGVDEKVRLIGINTPETVDPRTSIQCFGKEASLRAKELVGGKIVRLEFDDSQSMRDAYGRLLSYVFMEDGEMLNRKMVAEGYAYEYTYLKPYKYQKEFRGLQNIARVSGRGLWAANTCDGHKDLPQ